MKWFQAKEEATDYRFSYVQAEDEGQARQRLEARDPQNVILAGAEPISRQLIDLEPLEEGFDPVADEDPLLVAISHLRLAEGTVEQCRAEGRHEHLKVAQEKIREALGVLCDQVGIEQAP